MGAPQVYRPDLGQHTPRHSDDSYADMTEDVTEDLTESFIDEVAHTPGSHVLRAPPPHTPQPHAPPPYANGNNVSQASVEEDVASQHSEPIVMHPTTPPPSWMAVAISGQEELTEEEKQEMLLLQAEIEGLEYKLAPMQSQLAALKIEVSLTRAEVRDGEKYYRELIEYHDQLEQSGQAANAELEYLRDLSFTLKEDLKSSKQRVQTNEKILISQRKMHMIAGAVWGLLVGYQIYHLFGVLLFRLMVNTLFYSFILLLIGGTFGTFKVWNGLSSKEKARAARKIRRAWKQSEVIVVGVVPVLGFVAFILLTQPEKKAQPVKPYFDVTNPRESLRELEHSLYSTQYMMQEKLDSVRSISLPQVGSAYKNLVSSKAPSQAVLKVKSVFADAAGSLASLKGSFIGQVKEIQENPKVLYEKMPPGMADTIKDLQDEEKREEMKQKMAETVKDLQDMEKNKAMFARSKSWFNSKVRNARHWVEDTFYDNPDKTIHLEHY